MSTRLRWFTLVLLAALIGHFVLTIIYSLQGAPVPPPVREISNRYAIPLFHQNWKLFAPQVPEYDNQLEYRFQSPEGWSEWADVSGSHGYSRGSKAEYMEQTLTGALAWQLANNLYARNQRLELERIVNSFDYFRALHFTRRMHARHAFETAPDSIQMRVRFRFTPPPGKAYTFQSSYMELPVEPFVYAHH